MKFFSTLNTQLDTAQKILELITPFVKQDKILPRTHTQINDNINDFVLRLINANILLKLLMVMSAQQVALCCIQSVLKRQTLASRKSVLLQLGQW
jgi:N-acetylglutamate synthase-like GNAT family acetyltransferase